MSKKVKFEFQGPSPGPRQDRWHLIEETVIQVPTWTEMQTIRLPGDYTGFNGASVPSVLWIAFGFPMSKRLVRAGLLHDAAYQRYDLHAALGVKDRDDADRLFRSVVIEDGVPKHTAWAMYAGLRVGGGPFWLAASGATSMQRKAANQIVAAELTMRQSFIDRSRERDLLSDRSLRDLTARGVRGFDDEVRSSLRNKKQVRVDVWNAMIDDLANEGKPEMAGVAQRASDLEEEAVAVLDEFTRVDWEAAARLADLHEDIR